MNRLPQTCNQQVADGSFHTVLVRQLQVGNTVRVQAGQPFPEDAAVQSEHATVDAALLTGESHPVTRPRGESVVAGSHHLGGPVLVAIQRLGRETRFSQIVALMEKASTEKPRLAVLADRIAAPFLVIGLFWWALQASQLDNFEREGDRIFDRD